MIADKWILDGCVMAASFMAVVLLVGAEQGACTAAVFAALWQLGRLRAEGRGYNLFSYAGFHTNRACRGGRG